MFTYLGTVIILGIIAYGLMFMVLGSRRTHRVLSWILRASGFVLLRAVMYLGKVLVLTLINTGALFIRLFVCRGRPALVSQAWAYYRERMADVVLGRC